MDPEGVLAHERVRKALNLSEELSHINEEMPPVLRPTVETLNEPHPLAPLGAYRIFPNISTAVLHNNFLFFQILLHEEIIRALESVSDHTECQVDNMYESVPCPTCTRQFTTSASIIHSYIDSVCMNVYAFLRRNTKSLCSGVSADYNKRLICVVGSGAIIWPLYKAGKTPLCPPEKRAWIGDRLEQFAQESGIQQGRILARLLPRQMDILPELLKGEFDEDAL